MNKLLKAGIIVSSVLVTLMVGVAVVGPKVDEAGYRYVVGGAALSYVTPTGKEVKELKEKTGGIIHGVCHPKFDVEGIKSANIDWVRFDLTCPVLDKNGNETTGYKQFKADCEVYTSQGIKVMCVTPYPTAYLYSSEFGGDEDKGIISSIDPRTESGMNKIIEDAKYMAVDLQNYCGALQVTNEMTVDRFRKPLTMDEAANYIGKQLEAMYPLRGDMIIGYNVADFSMYQFYLKVGDYNKYCDYLGLDLYLGCFESTFKDLFWYDIILRGLYNRSKLPMIVNEFGYIGAGQTLSDEQRVEFLKQFGFNSEDEAKENIIELIDHPSFNQTIKNNLYKEANNEVEKNPNLKLEDVLVDLLFNPENTNNYRQHFYAELNNEYQLTKYEHTREGQASFYHDVIEDHFMKMPFLCGCFAYCWKDSSTCYICGSADCPVETGWGFKDLNGEYKPSYYALKEAYAKWN